MKQRSGWVSVVIFGLLLTSACGDDQDEASPEPVRARLELDALEVQPGSEGLFCQTFANPFAGDVDVARWSAELEAGGHHVLVFAVADSIEEPLAPCAGNDLTSPIVFQGQSAGQHEMRYPAGIAARIPAATALRVQVHALNASSQAVRVDNVIELELATEGTVDAHVAPLRLETFDISVPPGSKATASKTCKLPTDAQLVWAVSHMHVHGVGFELVTAGETLYATDTWVDPPARVFDPPRALAAGSEIGFSCSYDNPSAEPIGFGPSLDTDEMCVVVGGYVSAADDGALLDCDDGPDAGCLSCFLALVQQEPERACTDDGPPSSKVALDALEACTCGATSQCGDQCADSSCAGEPPSDACRACLETECAAESEACFGDAGP